MDSNDSTKEGQNGNVEGAISPGRRRFLAILSLILGAFTAALMAVPAVGFFLESLLRKRPSVWRSVGPVENFKVGETVAVDYENAGTLPWDGQMARTAAWLRREEEQKFIAFTVNCTHLGCPVRWEAKAEIFLCPCHGGIFYKDGKVGGGPPPRPLPRYNVRVREGQVEIETQPMPIGYSA